MDSLIQKADSQMVLQVLEFTCPQYLPNSYFSLKTTLSQFQFSYSIRTHLEHSNNILPSLFTSRLFPLIIHTHTVTKMYISLFHYTLNNFSPPILPTDSVPALQSHHIVGPMGTLSKFLNKELNSAQKRQQIHIFLKDGKEGERKLVNRFTQALRKKKRSLLYAKLFLGWALLMKIKHWDSCPIKTY